MFRTIHFRHTSSLLTSISTKMTTLITPASTTAIAVKLTIIPPRRTLFTSSKTAKPRRTNFKSFIARWTLAGAGVYYYMTSDIFSGDSFFRREQSKLVEDHLVDGPDRYAILDELAKRQRESEKVGVGSDGQLKVPLEKQGGREAAPGRRMQQEEGGLDNAGKSMEELEEEAAQQEAYNEETGEINWDCPCLGGMAHGPCGGEFKDAFSCFIYSTAEPKGVDCIDKFKNMQECFRRFPDVYANEIGDDDEEEEAEAGVKGDGQEQREKAEAVTSAAANGGAPTSVEGPTAQPVVELPTADVPKVEKVTQNTAEKDPPAAPNLIPDTTS